MKQIFATLILCSTCLSPLLAKAAEPPAKSVRVSFAELDLRKEAGIKELYSRLRRASREVCGDSYTGVRQRVRQQDYCFEETLDSAVSSLGNPLLERIHTRS